MSKRKGLSLEEKRSKLLECFHESKDVFVFKDVEKMGMKKGIVLQSIKDVLQSLVDDNLVNEEKIGISKYYWSFPSDTSCKLEHEVQQTQKQLADLKRRKTDIQAEVEKQRHGKEHSSEREQLLATLNALRHEDSSISTSLLQYKDNDPKAVEDMWNAAEAAYASANRWLDNLNCMADWCKRRFTEHGEAFDGLCKENGFNDSMEPIEFKKK